eukprot:gnl/Carplike_NY0171/1997_a2693_775.p1 GENE.gnl/Carplike_NY0171/1997_a2693_775~~gnl/Carplike_NY0171/1997_a2693_775.p1  ORF type:complete len:127 (+),score=34.46 gnl/Carplike_NY0171/1997_a2693_775:21-401(+)
MSLIDRENACREFISDVLGVERLDKETPLIEQLHDGILLIELINGVEKDIIPKYNTSKFPFMNIERAYLFVKACKKLGVPEYELFSPDQLCERPNPKSVFITIESLKRNALGGKKKEEEERKRKEE